MRWALSILLGLGLAASLVMAAQAPERLTRADLERIELARDAALARLKELEQKGDAAARETSEIEADLLAAAADSRRRELEAEAAEARIVELEQAAAIARSLLDQDETAREDLLAALIMLGARPPPVFVAPPEDAGEAIRAAILMGDAAPQLSERAGALRGRIHVLTEARARIDAEKAALLRSRQALLARRAEIEALATEKRFANADIATQTAGLRAEADRLAREARDLRALLDGLAEASASLDRRDSRETSGRPRATPALGQPVRVFGETGETSQPGITYATRPGAQVVSPGDARVAFADDFRSYGRMLILDVGEDELVILSGLDVLYPEAGQWVLAGEPVGRMADRAGAAAELYLEVRRRGYPVDPDGWLHQGT